MNITSQSNDVHNCSVCTCNRRPTFMWCVNLSFTTGQHLTPCTNVTFLFDAHYCIEKAELTFKQYLCCRRHPNPRSGCSKLCCCHSQPTCTQSYSIEDRKNILVQFLDQTEHNICNQHLWGGNVNGNCLIMTSYV